MSTYKNDTVYFCKTQKDAEKLFAYLDKKGYAWAGGEKLRPTNTRFDNKNGKTYHIHGVGDKACIMHGSLDFTISQGCTITYDIPGILPLKPEFEREFKRMFKTNRLPDEFSEYQIKEMKSKKVYKKWIEQEK